MVGFIHLRMSVKEICNGTITIVFLTLRGRYRVWFGYLATINPLVFLM